MMPKAKKKNKKKWKVRGPLPLRAPEGDLLRARRLGAGAARERERAAEVAARGPLRRTERRKKKKKKKKKPNGKDLLQRLMEKGLMPLAALDVIRGWMILEMSTSIEDERRITKAATRNKLGYHKIKQAPLSMYEDRGSRGSRPPLRTWRAICLLD